MAASKGQVRVGGVREMQAALKRVAHDAADMTAAHKAVSAALVPGVALRTPRRTGALSQSWSGGGTKTRARLTSSLPYAGPIEYGWSERGIEPARMVRDTVDASQREIVDAYQHELAKLAARDGFEARET